jgi:hypothetical protein
VLVHRVVSASKSEVESAIIIDSRSGTAVRAWPILHSGPLRHWHASEQPLAFHVLFHFALVQINTVAHTMRVQVTVSGLLAGSTASHIHATTALPGTGTAGVATTTLTFPGFPLGVASGTYDNRFDMTMASSYNPAFVTANGDSVAASEAVLFSAMAAGEAFLNIHSTRFPGGEIRGFLTPVPALPAVGLGAGCVSARRFVRCRAIA